MCWRWARKSLGEARFLLCFNDFFSWRYLFANWKKTWQLLQDNWVCFRENKRWWPPSNFSSGSKSFAVTCGLSHSASEQSEAASSEWQINSLHSKHLVFQINLDISTPRYVIYLPFWAEVLDIEFKGGFAQQNKCCLTKYSMTSKHVTRISKPPEADLSRFAYQLCDVTTHPVTNPQ